MNRLTPWDERYDCEDYLYGTAPNDFLVSMHDQLPVGRTLCVAEGEGRNAVWLAEQGHRVVAVDASRVGLAKARNLARERGVSIETVVAELGNFALPAESFDLVVSIFAHLPGSARRKLHRNIVQALRPGGMLLLEAYTPEQLRFGTGGPPDLDKLMPLAALRSELEGLHFNHALECEREIIEGKLHTGVGAVVQVVATRPS